MAGANIKRVIPREELSEFQRWQFSSLLEDPLLRAGASEVAAESPPVAETPPPPLADEVAPAPVVEVLEPAPAPALNLPTAEELAAIERQAQEEGFQSGLAAGRLAAEAEVQRLRALLGEVEAVCKDVEGRIAHDVLDLALVIARQILHQEVHLDRTSLLPQVREALAGLPPIQGPARILLNPDDLTAVNVLLTPELPGEYWRLVPDPALAAGSCRVETPVSSIDLTMNTRWQNLLRVLGRARRSDLAWHDAPLAATSDLDMTDPDDDLD